jgi:hypothetical protein
MLRNTLFHPLVTAFANGMVGLAIALIVLTAPALAKSISGVCPDGSIFIVQRLSSVPCPDAKQVDPNDIPPLNPELLPRPYGWEQFQGRQDPNNPYNVVDSAPSMRLLGGPRQEFPSDRIRQVAAQEQRHVPQMLSPPELAPQASSPLALTSPMRTAPQAPQVTQTNYPSDASDATTFFPAKDLRDLALIVELSQRKAPATFRPRGEAAEESKGLTLRIAYSASFEPRLRSHFSELGGLPPGNVVLFSVVASDTQAFFGNLTFVQSGAVYHPKTQDMRDLGLLQRELGMLREGETLLGYARLPEDMDVTREMDIYWNDRLLTTTLKPS